MRDGSSGTSEQMMSDLATAEPKLDGIEVDPRHPEQAILARYQQYKQGIRRAAAQGDPEACLERLWDCWMYMNRFRNCDLRLYFDHDLHQYVAAVNPKRFDTAHLWHPKREFRIAYVFGYFSETGGASIAHRYILERPADMEGARFKQFALIANTTNDQSIESYSGFRYLRDKVELEELAVVPPNPSWVAKGRYIEQWLYERQIDFAVLDIDPASLYACASKPVPLIGILTQDSHTFTIGPGAADFTFLVTRDQLFKYALPDPAPERMTQVLLLPLHAQAYVDAAVPIPRRELDVPEDAVVSVSTNLWKHCFGDTEVLLHAIGELARRHPNYHHLFVGTPRSSDTLDYFLSRHPALRSQLHYLGVIPNLYRVLKSVDFLMNSFPISGGSDIEAAAVGIPSIELVANRNFNLHECEFLQSFECLVSSLDGVIRLGERFITDPAYRRDLGASLQSRVRREFDKSRILSERVYLRFVHEFRRRLAGEPPAPALELSRTIHYERSMECYSKFSREQWPSDGRRAFLRYCIEQFPEKPFGWIKAIEEAILQLDRTWFDRLCQMLEGSQLLHDARIHVMKALAWRAFGNREEARAEAQCAVELSTYNPWPASVLAKLALEEGDTAAAITLFRVHMPVLAGVVALRDDEVLERVRRIDLDALPIFYDY